jgi:hypothetical protein
MQNDSTTEVALALMRSKGAAGGVKGMQKPLENASRVPGAI